MSEVPLNGSIEALMHAAANRGNRTVVRASTLDELAQVPTPRDEEKPAQNRSQSQESASENTPQEDHSQGQGTPRREPDLGERFRAFMFKNHIY